MGVIDCSSFALGIEDLFGGMLRSKTELYIGSMV